MKKLIMTYMLIFNGAVSYILGATYYVSTTGNDNNSGGISAPYATLQKAVDMSVSGADIIYVEAGIYNQAVYVEEKNGITLTSYNNEDVYIQGDVSVSNAIITISNSSNVKVSNLNLQNLQMNWAVGILVIGTGTNIQISDNTIRNIHYKSASFNSGDNPGSTSVGANPIEVVGDNSQASLNEIIIDSNEVYECMTGWCEGIAIKGNVENFTISQNYVHDITNIGIDAFGLGTYPVLDSNYQSRNGVIQRNTVHNCKCNYTDNGGIYVDGAKDVCIINNTVYNNIYGITIGCENQMNIENGSTSGVQVHSNFVYNNDLAGIMIGTSGDDDGLQGTVVNCDVKGNTFLKNSTTDEWGTEFVVQNCSAITVENNIIYSLYSQMFTYAIGASNIVFNYNDYYYSNGSEGQVVVSQQLDESNWAGITLTAFKDLVGGDATSIFANPLLVSDNVADGNFHMTEISPCVNAGNTVFTALASEFDMDLSSRVVGSRVDIGCDETGSNNGNIEVVGITIAPETLSLEEGVSYQLSYVVLPEEATNKDVSWTSENNSIASVDDAGKVTAISEGTTNIIVTTTDGDFAAECAITISSKQTESSITVDGDLSDWDNIAAIATATEQSCTSLKVYSDEEYFYFAIAGSGLSDNYQIWLNTDNNTSTGYDDWNYRTSGADYYIENGILRKSTGTGWGWTDISMSIDEVNTSSVTEIRVSRAELGDLASTIKVAYSDVNTNWAVVSTLGYSDYTLLKSKYVQQFKNNIEVYPNPVNDILVIDLGGSQEESILEIYSLQGQKLYQTSTHNQLIEISMNQIKVKGLVLVKITRGELTEVYRILCE